MAVRKHVGVINPFSTRTGLYIYSAYYLVILQSFRNRMMIKIVDSGHLSSDLHRCLLRSIKSSNHTLNSRLKCDPALKGLSYKWEALRGGVDDVRLWRERAVILQLYRLIYKRKNNFVSGVVIF